MDGTLWTLIAASIAVQSEADVDAYVYQHLYQPLENAFPLPGFTHHEIQSHTQVQDMMGQPDFVATGLDITGCQRLLFAAESKTAMSFLVPGGMTTAQAWQDPGLRKGIAKGMGQVLGYMKHNDLTYSLLTTGDRFIFMQREGSSLQIADVLQASKQPTPMAAIYYLMQR